MQMDDRTWDSVRKSARHRLENLVRDMVDIKRDVADTDKVQHLIIQEIQNWSKIAEEGRPSRPHAHTYRRYRRDVFCLSLAHDGIEVLQEVFGAYAQCKQQPITLLQAMVEVVYERTTTMARDDIYISTTTIDMKDASLTITMIAYTMLGI